MSPLQYMTDGMLLREAITDPLLQRLVVFFLVFVMCEWFLVHVLACPIDHFVIDGDSPGLEAL